MTPHDPACPWKGDPALCPFRHVDYTTGDNELERLMRRKPDAPGED